MYGGGGHDRTSGRCTIGGHHFAAVETRGEHGENETKTPSKRRQLFARPTKKEQKPTIPAY